MTNEQFKQLQEMFKFCEEGIKELKHKDHYTKKEEAQKKQDEFDKFYKEHVAKYGNEI
ncbi:hypothetical protein [Bacillus pacificus]|uniref:hypothetical protein n=1 Tax=Bacillus pacificus TaxID=2026187 RepID=UPI00178C268B|nr:hypothetical protein [Bacillus pacificus]